MSDKDTSMVNTFDMLTDRLSNMEDFQRRMEDRMRAMERERSDYMRSGRIPSSVHIDEKHEAFTLVKRFDGYIGLEDHIMLKDHVVLVWAESTDLASQWLFGDALAHWTTDILRTTWGEEKLAVVRGLCDKYAEDHPDVGVDSDDEDKGVLMYETVIPDHKITNLATDVISDVFRQILLDFDFICMTHGRLVNDDTEYMVQLGGVQNMQGVAEAFLQLRAAIGPKIPKVDKVHVYLLPGRVVNLVKSIEDTHLDTYREHKKAVDAMMKATGHFNANFFNEVIDY